MAFGDTTIISISISDETREVLETLVKEFTTSSRTPYTSDLVIEEALQVLQWNYWADMQKRSRMRQQEKDAALIRQAKLLRSDELAEMPYREYLQTPEWQKLRNEALERAGYACELCGLSREFDNVVLNVHHKRYSRRRGEEYPSDLIVLCHDCHAKFHGKLAPPEEET